MTAETGCQCDKLPLIDLDGGSFDGLCRWCAAVETEDKTPDSFSNEEIARA